MGLQGGKLIVSGTCLQTSDHAMAATLVQLVLGCLASVCRGYTLPSTDLPFKAVGVKGRSSRLMTWRGRLVRKPAYLRLGIRITACVADASE